MKPRITKTRTRRVALAAGALLAVGAGAGPAHAHHANGISCSGADTMPVRTSTGNNYATLRSAVLCLTNEIRRRADPPREALVPVRFLRARPGATATTWWLAATARTSALRASASRRGTSPTSTSTRRARGRSARTCTGALTAAGTRPAGGPELVDAQLRPCGQHPEHALHQPRRRRERWPVRWLRDRRYLRAGLRQPRLTARETEGRPPRGRPCADRSHSAVDAWRQLSLLHPCRRAALLPVRRLDPRTSPTPTPPR